MKELSLYIQSKIDKLREDIIKFSDTDGLQAHESNVRLWAYIDIRNQMKSFGLWDESVGE